MTCIDAFSRFAICVPLMNKTMSCVARNFVDHVICAYGPIESLYTDRGLEWVGSDFKEAVRNLGISQSFTCAFSPNSNGLVERYNKSIIEILRCLCYEQPSSWDSSLRLAMLAFNSSYCVPIRESPHFIFFLRDPLLPYDEILKPKSQLSSVKNYPEEQLIRAQRVFSLCKAFSEEQISNSNAKKNVKRDFKDISVGSRIYKKYDTEK